MADFETVKMFNLGFM